MSIWARVATAVRGGGSEAGEAIVDHQALRILDQEIRDADNGLGKSKDALTDIIAKRKLADKKVAGLKSSLKEYENYAMQALDKNDDALAGEIAGKIAGLGGVYDETILPDFVKRGMRFFLGGADMSFILAGGKLRGAFFNNLKV